MPPPQNSIHLWGHLWLTARRLIWRIRGTVGADSRHSRFSPNTDRTLAPTLIPLVPRVVPLGTIGLLHDGGLIRPLAMASTRPPRRRPIATTIVAVRRLLVCGV
jgi:hypothetical protein